MNNYAFKQYSQVIYKNKIYMIQKRFQKDNENYYKIRRRRKFLKPKIREVAEDELILYINKNQIK